MSRDELGGFPYEVDKVRGKVIIRFFSKSSADYPDDAVLKLSLDGKDVKKLLRIPVD